MGQTTRESQHGIQPKGPELPSTANGQRPACMPILSCELYIKPYLQYMPTCDLQGITYSGPSVAAAALDRGASGWDSARESRPFSQRREPRTGPRDWTKPSIAEVMDQGGSAVERERAYPVPSPRGTLPTWMLSGDDLNLVHNRRSSLVQARTSRFFFGRGGTLLSLRPAFISFTFSSLPSPT